MNKPANGSVPCTYVGPQTIHTPSTGRTRLDVIAEILLTILARREARRAEARAASRRAARRARRRAA
jgi:hypothetical protein